MTPDEPCWEVSAIVSKGHGVAVCDRPALGTSARVVVWPYSSHPAACTAVDAELDRLDREVSRFRRDSELSLAESNAGLPTLLSAGAAEAVTVALAAACVSGGRVDPTVGSAMCALGYDRDFDAIDGRTERRATEPAPGWRSVHLAGHLLRLTAGTRLDLGATAKGLGADRSASAAFAALGGRGGVLVSLGGDVSVAGIPPETGWPIAVSEAPDSWPAAGVALTVLRLPRGGVATSSVLHRRWRSGDRTLHHILNPASGEPVTGPWRTATVAGRSCVEANTASTTAIVAGDDAERWLSDHGLPARLVARDGAVRLLGGWPEAVEGTIPVPRRSIFDRQSAERSR